MVAVVMPSRTVQLMSRRTREALPVGRRRAHFSDEGDAVRRRLLDAYVGLDVRAVVVVSAHGGGDDQPAREACLGVLVPALVGGNVQTLVLDTRGPDRDRLDRQWMERLRRADILGQLQYTHQGSREQILLGLPDAIAWAYGAGGPWLTKVRHLPLTELQA